jgi:hypothetical protein
VNYVFHLFFFFLLNSFYFVLTIKHCIHFRISFVDFKNIFTEMEICHRNHYIDALRNIDHLSNPYIITIQMITYMLTRVHFRISFVDFKNIFTEMEICHLGPESLKTEPSIRHREPWAAAVAHRQWRKGFNAGGFVSVIWHLWIPIKRVGLVESRHHHPLLKT